MNNKKAFPEIDLINIFDDFLTLDECDFIITQLEFSHWRHSHLINRGEKDEEQPFKSHRRVSETANQEWFTDELDVFITEIELRFKKIIPFDTSHLEYWQGTRYPIGGKLDHHLDSGYWTNHYAGERKFTFLIYLTTPISGGSTYFRALDLKVKAVAGRLLIWNNLFEDGSPNHKTVHCGSTLEAGNKITLVTWLRQFPIRL